MDVNEAADALLKRWEDADEQPSDQATEEATAEVEQEETEQPEQEDEVLEEVELDDDDEEIAPRFHRMRADWIVDNTPQLQEGFDMFKEHGRKLFGNAFFHDRFIAKPQNSFRRHSGNSQLLTNMCCW